MTYRDEYVALQKAEIDRCNSRIDRCAREGKTADERVRAEMRALRERRREALLKLRRFETFS